MRSQGLRRAVARFDLVTLSDICVDIVLPVNDLPSSEPVSRLSLLSNTLASLAEGSDRSGWEVGGSCNVSIAAARLGLHVAKCGNLASDAYGHFLRETLMVLTIHSCNGHECLPVGACLKGVFSSQRIPGLMP